MAVIVVTSNGAGEGKTGVAAAIARRYAYLGRGVRLARVGAADDSDAVADARWFGSLDFTPGSSSTPIAPSAAADPGETLLVVEANAAEAAQVEGAKVVLVSHGGATPETPPGLVPAVSIRTNVHGLPASTPEGGALVISLPEDRTLGGFSISEAQRVLSAETLVEGDVADATCDYLVIAPIGSDAGQPYFRRFSNMAVVVRFDKTDMHLAALKGDPTCLILTGGRRPSDYLFDAATASGVPVLLSRTDTENTVIALERIWERTRFQGERKLDRMAELLEGSALWEALE